MQCIKNRHQRRILAQFCTGLHWLNIQTGRQNNTARSDRTCPERITNPGIPKKYFDALNSDEEGCEAVKDEHHMVFDCSS